MVKKNKAVFLDRDGVINKAIIKKGKSYAPRKLKDFKILPYVKNSIAKLKEIGFKIFVISNQPDVGKKLISRNVLKKMNNKIIKATLVDKIYVCTHQQDENCFCRKPNPGMLLNAAKKYRLDLKKSFLVGDRASDIAAGQNANCRSIFLNKKYKENVPNTQEATFTNLKEATSYILEQEKLENA